ncbi:4F5 protein family [Musa troglodytarum]|uniref:4F5 protein family n=1 Tax=Musa troglodytarum TaxID=320322 RepID=A0A9E7H3Q2_9LILI|nr:4F5 protein family [Musa troglodytarum]
MGGGNGQKSKMAREKNIEKNKAPKGSQLESNKKAMTIQCYHAIHMVFVESLCFCCCKSSARYACKHLYVPHRKSSAENMPKQSIPSPMFVSASPTLRSSKQATRKPKPTKCG